MSTRFACCNAARRSGTNRKNPREWRARFRARARSDAAYPGQESSRMDFLTALPIDTIALDNTVQHPKALKAALQALAIVGMNAVVVEVWWGLVEVQPGRYCWEAYEHLFDLLESVNMRAHVRLCFHGNEHVPLPAWVLELAALDPDMFFTDRSGNHSRDCLTFGVDDLPVLHRRTAIQCYRDLMLSFRRRFRDRLGPGGTIQCVNIGMGPNGLLAFPAFPPSDWEFPGIGEFQCYDDYLLTELHATAVRAGHPEYGYGGPHDAGSYCQWPHQTKFFRNDGSWTTPYGQFFRKWYSDLLLQHADSMLAVARHAFGCTHVKVSGTLPCVHWWHQTASHAAELTAGVNHTHGTEGYLPIVKVFARHGCYIVASGCEQSTAEQPHSALCDPDELLGHVRTCASIMKVPVAFETQHIRFDEAAFATIEEQLFDRDLSGAVALQHVQSFIFNRMGSLMFEPSNWHRFKAFTQRLRQRAQALSSTVVQAGC